MASMELHDLKFSPAMWNFICDRVHKKYECTTSMHEKSVCAMYEVPVCAEERICVILRAHVITSSKRMTFFGNIIGGQNFPSGYGLVAMTFASHAKGREFDPHYPYFVQARQLHWGLRRTCQPTGL